MRSIAWIIVVTLTLATTNVATAADDHEHAHSPIIVRSRPVIERLPLKVIEPVDVVSTAQDETLVADRAGRIVFRIDSAGDVSVIARNLDNLRSIATHRTGIFCLQGQGPNGQIVQITETGFRSDPIDLRFPATGLAIDDDGSLWVGNARRSELIQLQRFDDTWKRRHVQLSDLPLDVQIDHLGRILVLLKSGRIVSVHPGSSETLQGYAPRSAKRINVHPTEGPLALGFDKSLRPSVFRLTSRADEETKFASLPEGTVAISFDRLGNLTSANPDLRAITRVTSRFQVPCPHCGKLVPMVLSPNARPAVPAQRRSF